MQFHPWRRQLGSETKVMTLEHLHAIRASQPLRLLSRRLLSQMTREEAENYRYARRVARMSIAEALRVAGRPDLLPEVGA